MVTINNPRCLNCNSTQTYIRSETQQRLCRSCGTIENLKKEVKP